VNHIKKIFLCLLVTVLFSFNVLIAVERVLVSVAPYMEIVQEIGGDSIIVELMVPQGADSHNFEPTPKQIQEALSAKIWFCIGEAFEKKAEIALQSQNASLAICNLRQVLPAEDKDPHIWMSLKLMMKQAELIAKELETTLPEHRVAFKERLQILLGKLEALDHEIKNILKGKQGEVILVAHPAFGYFCRDYGLTQLSIEEEGKEPTAKRLTELLKEARRLKIKKIFLHTCCGHKGAALIAKELGAQLVTINSYSPHYFEMMLNIAHQFQEADL